MIEQLFTGYRVRIITRTGERNGFTDYDGCEAIVMGSYAFFDVCDAEGARPEFSFGDLHYYTLAVLHNDQVECIISQQHKKDMELISIDLFAGQSILHEYFEDCAQQFQRKEDREEAERADASARRRCGAQDEEE